MIVALSRETRTIGNNNTLLWHIPEDLKRFKKLTSDHPLIMGRKTFESILDILGTPLPNRTNIVITHNPSYSHESDNVHVVHSLADALDIARDLDSEEIFIGGGQQIYEQALPVADRLYLTLIDSNKDGDTFFPEYTHEFTRVIDENTHEHNGLAYTWITLEREYI